MPPFYAQQMAAANYLPCRVVSEAKSPNDELDVTATRSDDGSTLVLKVVNTSNKSHGTSIETTGLGSIASQAEVTTLSGKLGDINPPDAPAQIHSVRTTFDRAADRFEYEFPAYSYTILGFKRKP
jgi:alpha-L-arabinofuranosidase